MSYKQYKQEWLQHDITKDLIKEIKDVITTLKDEWSSGAFTAESAEGTVQRNAQALGQVQALENTLDYITSVVEDQNDN